jgi:hypothetical protein
MKPNPLLHDESGSPKPILQNVAGSKVTQRPGEGTPGCSCDRWGHPSPDCVEHNVQVQLKLSFSAFQYHRQPRGQRVGNQIDARDDLCGRTS